MSKLLTPLLLAVIIMVGAFYSLACFKVGEWEQAVVLQFGRPVQTAAEAGLYFKLPFVQNVVTFDKRLLEYDAAPRELITQDKQQLVVDNFSRWRIVDPLKFFQTVLTEAGAQSRLDDIIYSNLRENIGRTFLRDVVSGDRPELMQRVISDSNIKADAYGVEIVDIRIKRADLPAKNEQNVYNRMRTERERQAKTFRAEGEEESRKIRSQAEKDREILLAEARRTAEIMRGEAEATATGTYSAAHSRDPEFFEFMRTLEAYRVTLADRTTLVLDTDSGFLELLSNDERDE
jgi:membrane protease subunit HflC